MPFREDLKPDRLVDLEKEVLDTWARERTFERVLEARRGGTPWVFYEGPPTANGKPGLHHVLSRGVKDLRCRFKTMQGHLVDRKGGWDTHGLPVELEVEKRLGLSGKKAIEALGIAKFNQLCRESVFHYLEDWKRMTVRMGYWVDLERAYLTCSREYVESLWWILATLFRRGLLYRGHKIVPYCPSCQTPLSSHEVGQGYKDVQDPSVFVRFAVEGEANTSFLVWTTTPWTLPSNVALAVHPDVDYVLVEVTEGPTAGERLWLAEARLAALGLKHAVVQRVPGRAIVGKRYQRLIDWYPLPPSPGPTPAFSVVAGGFVTTTDGTGVVHMAPAYGQDDHEVGKREGLPTLHPVDAQGRFVAGSPVAGTFVKEADKEILRVLKEAGRLFKRDVLVHPYPHCWRCETPLLYYARDSWYLRTTAVKDRMVELNRGMKWWPQAAGEGRFGQWLENNVDWAISRDRYWGTPLPLWVCAAEGCGHVEAVASDAELLARAGRRVEDLHRPFVDEVTFPCTKPGCSGTMKRTPEVVDVWFDSGAMPFAQWHYPFEHADRVEREHPAEFVAEAIDQTRGWFYTLLAVSTLLLNKPAMKSVACMELILDAQGKKMSKSRGNTVSPFELMEKYGADVVRWSLLARQMWVPLRFDVKDVEEVRSRTFGTLLNCYAFLAMYANPDGWDPRSTPPVASTRPALDRWLVARRERLVAEVTSDLEDMETGRAGQRIAWFVVEDLSNWWLRRSRRRFYGEGLGEDKLSAYATLREALITVARLMAPFAPFVTDVLHRALHPHEPSFESSVHVARWPAAELRLRDAGLEGGMEAVRRVVSLGHAARQKAGLNVRQPLASLAIWGLTGEGLAFVRAHVDVVKDELNVKKLEVVEALKPGTRLKATLDKKEAARRLGALTQPVTQALEALASSAVAHLLASETPRVTTAQGEVELKPADVRVVVDVPAGSVGEFGAGTLVVLDTALTPELVREGLAREAVRRLNDLRKSSGLRVEDRIRLTWWASGPLAEALRAHRDHVAAEILAVSFDEAPSPGDLPALDLPDHDLRASLTRA
jgi:isoleucyl-tRNA synthetase